MRQDNYASRIRGEIITRIARLFLSDELISEIDRIPIEMRPKGGEFSRCCVYKDRAILKYRCMATLGFSVENEEDELTKLSDYAKRALSRERLRLPVITVIHDGCDACVHSHFEVTNACHGCFAHPCAVNCPKDAIKIQNRHAVIDPDLCVRCGKCQKVCPYHAIIRIPIPCEEACPVGAISKGDDGRESINYSKCIFCGKCMVECPFGVIMEKSQIIDVLSAIKKGQKVVAMIAPAIAGQFKASLGEIATALLEFGFNEVVEVALGADFTSRKEADEFVERMAKGDKLMTSSCCYAYDEAVKKHMPELMDKVSKTPTPMHYTAEKVKEMFPDAVTVFIGPCVAKRKEAHDDPMLDYTLTFEEIASLFEAKNIDVTSCSEGKIFKKASWLGRGFPVSGGTTAAIHASVGDRAEMNPLLIDGLDKKSMKLLKIYAKGKCPGNFIEVMTCEGGCVGGPAVVVDTPKAAKQVEKLLQSTRGEPVGSDA